MKLGDITTLRRLFAFFGVNERNGDLSPITGRLSPFSIWLNEFCTRSNEQKRPIQKSEMHQT